MMWAANSARRASAIPDLPPGRACLDIARRNAVAHWVGTLVSLSSVAHPRSGMALAHAEATA